MEIYFDVYENGHLKSEGKFSDIVSLFRAFENCVLCYNVGLRTHKSDEVSLNFHLDMKYSLIERNWFQFEETLPDAYVPLKELDKYI